MRIYIITNIKDFFNRAIFKTKGRITLKEGDIVSVTVTNTNETIAQMLRNFFYTVSGKDTYQILAKHAGVVAVNGSTK